ncbi:MAG: hypothetical protein ACR2GF_02895 [Acidimicrobiales bacterium]
MPGPSCECWDGRPSRRARGRSSQPCIVRQIANSALIELNQIGTVTETLAAMAVPGVRA